MQKKKKHGMRYTQYRGLDQVTNRVNFKFATMNLKKLAIWKRKQKNLSPGKMQRRFFAADYVFYVAGLPRSIAKAFLGVIANANFFYRL